MSEGNEDKLIQWAMSSVKSREDAEKLIHGEIVDAWLFKIVLSIENKTGALVLLASEVNGKVLQVFSMIGNSKPLRKIGTFQSYSQFLEDMLTSYNEGGIESAISERIGRTLYRILTPDVISGQLPNFHYGQTKEIQDIILKGIIEETKVGGIQIQFELERINSIQFRLNNPLDGNYNEVVSPFIEMASQSSGTSSRSSFSPLPKTKIDLAIEDFINKHKEVIKCSTVLSPASGVTFDELREGQKLLFKLPFRTPEEKSKARRLGGVNKLGQPITITGTFLRLIVGPKDEYHIFAKGPHGVLLRAFEERPVRLAVPRYSEAGEGLEKNSKAMWIVAIGFLIFIAVLGVIYFL